MAYRSVLVVSPDPSYLDEVAEALADAGAFGVLVEDAGAAESAVGGGFVPEIVLLDPRLLGGRGAEEVLYLARTAPLLDGVPVLALSDLSPGTPGRNARQRVDRDVLLVVLHKCETYAASPLA